MPNISTSSPIPLPVTQGGTGQISAQAAIDALTGVSSATNEYVLTKDTATGNAIFKAASSGLFSNSSTNDYQTSTTNALIIGGTSPISSARVSVDGNADKVQVLVQGHSTQTSDVLRVEKSDASSLFSVTNASGITVGGTTAQIKDTNDKQLIAFGVSGSAVNYIKVWNAATGNHALIQSEGETNVGLKLSGKGSRGILAANAFDENIATLTDGATPALDASLGNLFILTAAGNRTIAVPTNPPPTGFTQKIVIRHLASGGARTLALNTGAGGFRYGTDVSGLTATTSGKTDYIGCIYNPTDTFWDVVAVAKGY